MQIDVRPGVEDAPLRTLLDREFDGTPGIFDEFPTLMGEANRGRRLIAESDGALVAHAAWRPFTLRSGARRIPAAGIGLVTTHLIWRGRGLACRLVEACVQDAKNEGALAAVLFAPSRSLYERLGFHPAGTERVTRLRRGCVSAQVRRGGPKDARRLLPLLEAHPAGVERTLQEFEAQLAVPETHLYLYEEEGRTTAYCIEGRGRDLRGVVHEWGGEPQHVARMLETVASEPSGPEWVLSPSFVPAPVEGVHHLGPMAQIRVLRPREIGSDDPSEAFGHGDRPGAVPIYIWGLDSV